VETEIFNTNVNMEIVIQVRLWKWRIASGYN